MRLCGDGASAATNPVYDIRLKYGRLYGDYRAPCAAWSVVYLVRKAALAAVAVLVVGPPDARAAIQFFCGICALGVPFMLHSCCAPHLGKQRLLLPDDEDLMDLQASAARDYGRLDLSLAEACAFGVTFSLTSFGYMFRSKTMVVGGGSYVAVTVIMTTALVLLIAGVIAFVVAANRRYWRAIHGVPAGKKAAAPAAAAAAGDHHGEALHAIAAVSSAAAAAAAVRPPPPIAPPLPDASQRVLEGEIPDAALARAVVDQLMSAAPGVPARALAMVDLRDEGAVAVAASAAVPRLLALLKSSSGGGGEPEVQLDIVSALWGLARGCASVRRALVSGGALLQLLELLPTAPAEALAPACGAVAGLLVDDATARAYYEMGGVPETCRLLESADEGVVEECALALRRLAGRAEPDVRAAILGTGETVPRLVVLLGAAGATGSDTSITESICATLAALAEGDARVRDAIVAAGALPALLEVVGSGTEGQKHEAACALVVLMVSDGDMRIAARVMDTPDAVPHLAALLSADSTATQAKAAAALAALAMGGPDSDAAMIAAGTVPALVRLLLSPSMEVSQQAASAVWSLAVGAAAAHSIADAGGADALVACLTASAPGTHDEEVALGALSCLAVHPDLHGAMLRAGVIPVLVERAASDVPDVAEAAASTLLSLSASDATHYAICEAGGVARLVALLAAAPAAGAAAEGGGVCETAAAALANLTAHGGTTCDAVVDAGAIPRLKQLLLAPEPGLQEQAVRVMANIAASEGDAALAIIRAAAVPVLATVAAAAAAGAPTAASTAASAALSSMVANTVLLHSVVASSSDLALVVRMLSAGASSVPVQDFGAAMLVAAAAHVEPAVFRPALAAAGGIPLLTDLLVAGSTGARAAAAGLCGVLAGPGGGTGDDDDVCAALVSAGVVERLLPAAAAAGAGTTGGDGAAAAVALLRAAVVALAALAGHERARALMLGADGARILIKLLRAHAAAPGAPPVLQEALLRALHLLSSDSAVACGAIADAGGIVLLVQLLHARSPLSCEKAAATLLCVSELSVPHKNVMIGAMAVPRLVELLAAEAPALQEVAARALASLASADGDPTNAAAIMRAPGGAARLVSLLRSGAPGVAQAAAHALAVLGMNEGMDTAVAAAGAVAPLVELLNSAVPETQKEAAGALWGLSAGSEAVRAAVAAAECRGVGTVELLSRVVQCESAGTQVQACGALSCLLSDDACQAMLLAAGGIPVVVELLGSPDVDVVENAVGALRNLASGSDGIKNAVLAAGAVPRLAAALRSHSEVVQELAAGALGSILEGADAPLQALVRESGAPAALRALLRSPAGAVQDAAKAALGACRS